MTKKSALSVSSIAKRTKKSKKEISKRKGNKSVLDKIIKSAFNRS